MRDWLPDSLCHCPASPWHTGSFLPQELCTAPSLITECCYPRSRLFPFFGSQLKLTSYKPFLTAPDRGASSGGCPFVTALVEMKMF